MPVCSRCKLDLSPECFSRSLTRKRGLHGYCKKCQKEYKNTHYANNREDYIEKKSRLREETREWFRDIKSKLFCGRCGENHPACLDFHHKDPTVKDIGVSQAVCDGWSRERILIEIAKCEILCSNCHRKEHWLC